MERTSSKPGCITEKRVPPSWLKVYLDSGICRTTGLLLLIPLLLSMLSACATLSEGECMTADWYQIGRLDGNEGYPRSRLFDHHEACAAYGIRPDNDAYYEGREAGLSNYCTPHNGFIEGRAGKQYRNVCSATTERDFLEEYRKGLALYNVNEEIEDVERAIDRKENQLDDEEISDKEKDRLRDSLRDDYMELRYLNRELIQLERISGSSGHLIY